MTASRLRGATRPQIGLALLATLLAALFLVVLGFRVFAPGTLPPARHDASVTSDRADAVTTAARKATIAFLDVDYRDMDPRVKKVLALSTGTFRKQYNDTAVNLTAAARQGQAVSSGVIRYIGISALGPDSATVFVAADSTVTNLAMQQAQQAGQKVDDKRYYRFQLNLAQVDGHWLLSDLQFVS